MSSEKPCPITGTADLTGRPDTSLQFVFADALAGEVSFAISLGDKGIDFGAPFAVVHTVENSRHIRRSLLQYPLEAETLFGSHDLLRVSRAYSSYFIGEGQAAFKEIDITVEFQTGEG